MDFVEAVRAEIAELSLRAAAIKGLDAAVLEVKNNLGDAEDLLEEIESGLTWWGDHTGELEFMLRLQDRIEKILVLLGWSQPVRYW